ncbi:ExeM/NucH family extracellular endonuclease, partial [Oscillatoriales cyanobacterium LEGE 11467]
YFTTFDNGSNGALGADLLAELTRQREKTVRSLAAIDADIVALTELENNGYGTGSAIADLTDALNGVVGAGTYTFVNPGVPMLGSGAIASGFLYKPAAVSEVGTAAFLNTAGIFEGTDVNVPPLAQTFAVTEVGNPSFGEKVTIAVNHFKSKDGTGTGANADAGDGRGNWNQTRIDGANALTAWLAADPTGGGDSDVLLVGDLNAYVREDPIAAIQAAGYANLDTASYSSSDRGIWGTLDYAFANDRLAPQVTGVARWRINADEPAIFDYNEEFQSAAQLNNWYNVDPYRATDVDPIVIGLNLNTPVPPSDATNQPPENLLPAVPPTIQVNQILAPIDLAIFDRESGVVPLQVTLTATQGTLALPEITGLDFLAGDGTDDTTLSFLGTLDAINIALAELRFTPTADFVGEASIEITTDDRDTSRPGGAQTDTDRLTISVTAEVPETPPQPGSNDGDDRPSGTPSNPTIPDISTATQFCPQIGRPSQLPGPNSTLNTIAGRFVEGDDNPNTLDGRSQVQVTFSGWAGDDNLLGSPGDDLLFANQDADYIEAGEGDDWIFAGKGNDRVRGNGGNDRIAGDLGGDRLFAEEGNDLLFGNAGNDRVDGGSGDDTIYAGMDDDAAVGGIGDDVLAGDLGNDCLHGEGGDDRLFGNLGMDVLDGGLDNDRLYGGRENDTLLGSLGSDVLSGDRGNDLLLGGFGGDRFDFSPGDGSDTIADFTDGIDIIGLRDGLTFADFTFAQVGNDTQMMAVGLSITLRGVNTDAIEVTDFAQV